LRKPFWGKNKTFHQAVFLIREQNKLPRFVRRQQTIEMATNGLS